MSQEGSLLIGDQGSCHGLTTSAWEKKKENNPSRCHSWELSHVDLGCSKNSHLLSSLNSSWAQFLPSPTQAAATFASSF